MIGKPKLYLLKQTDYNKISEAKEILPFGEYHLKLISLYAQRCTRKNYATGTIKGIVYALETALDFINKPLWEIKSWDVDKYSDAMINSGLKVSTRRYRIGTLRRFIEWVIRNYSMEIQQNYKTRLIQPVTEDSHIIHNYDDLRAKSTPPSRAILAQFFSSLYDLINRSDHPIITARDYTIFKLQYLVGMRIDEVIMLDLKDIRFDLGDLGKIHVRFGKGSNTSGKRQRWVPMIAGARELLQWYMKNIRPRFGTSEISPAMFPSFHETRIKSKSISNTLGNYIAIAGIPEDLSWGTHAFRHACATYNFEDGMQLVAIQQLLGHEDIRTTMIYVSPNQNFIETNYKDMISQLTGKYKNLRGE